MNPSVILVAGNLQAEIIPEEGGVLSRLTSQGESFLTQTPWSSNVKPSVFPAPDEASWVNNWRGGWQLCAPNTGLPEINSASPAFHGAASQASWEVIEATQSSIGMRWVDSRGEMEIHRSWALFDSAKVVVSSVVTNHSDATQTIGVAEHLILGSDFLTPIKRGATANLAFSPEAEIIELDYSGAPTGKQLSGSESNSDWTNLTSDQPARVFALAKPKSRRISVELENWTAEITWEGLDHALVWQEFGTSKESPWNGEVFALGIEPTNIAHGLGTNADSGPFIQPGAQLRWSTSLQLTRKAVS
jgi:galactose mutarotase-like enzyme